MACVIAIANNKGGAGKTTTAINLSAALSLEGERSLLIDADSQASVSSWNAIRPESLPQPGFEIVSIQRATIHKDIQPLKKQYDWIIIDCPAGANTAGGQMTRSAILGCDLVIIPLVPSGPDFWSTDEMLKMFSEIDTLVDGIIKAILINRFQPNTTLGASAHSAVEQLGIPILKTTIPNRQAISLATSAGKTIYEHNDREQIFRCYDKLAKEVRCLMSAKPR